MSQDQGWRAVSDPEADGVPSHADDDSTANDEVHSPREADGPEPSPLPAGRGDGPLGLDEQGESSLAERLAREEPEPAGDLAPGELAQLVAEGPVEPRAQSPVSMYDREPPADEEVTRLVAPDEGFGEDTEAEAVAYDAGMAGGGPSAEEAAMHLTGETETRPDEQT